MLARHAVFLTPSKSRNTCLPNSAVNFLQNAELFHLTSFISHSCALFCTHENRNSFLFKCFRTLCKKPSGVGVPPLLSKRTKWNSKPLTPAILPFGTAPVRRPDRI